MLNVEEFTVLCKMSFVYKIPPYSLPNNRNVLLINKAKTNSNKDRRIETKAFLGLVPINVTGLSTMYVGILITIVQFCVKVAEFPKLA